MKRSETSPRRPQGPKSATDFCEHGGTNLLFTRCGGDPRDRPPVLPLQVQGDADLSTARAVSVSNMDIYLIRHGQVDYSRATDPYSPELTPEGLAQAERVARQCQGWGVQFLCASTMIRAQQTADAIERSIPGVIRWDLEELEEMNVGDLELDPRAGPWVSTWTPEQVSRGYARTSARVMAALVRIQIYARAKGLERIALVTHGYVIKLVLLAWLGLDSRAASEVQIPIAYCGTCKIVLGYGDVVRIEWINRR